MDELIRKQDVIDALSKLMVPYGDGSYPGDNEKAAYDEALVDAIHELENLPTVQPELLTDDDFETIRIHLNAYKENLCNQQRWKEAEEYQSIIDRFMAFASAQPKRKYFKPYIIDALNQQDWKCSVCGQGGCAPYWNYCPWCGEKMER